MSMVLIGSTLVSKTKGYSSNLYWHAIMGMYFLVSTLILSFNSQLNLLSYKTNILKIN